MKNNNNHHHCGNPLCNTCGSVLNLSSLEFNRSDDHLLYMDKVYSREHASACPIVFDLTTTQDTYQTQLLLSPMQDENLCCPGSRNNSCNCNCNCCNECNIDELSVFNISNSYVRILSFEQTNPCNLFSSQVTVNGLAVDGLECQSGLFEATLSQSLPTILNNTCTENNLPTKAFFLISDAGPWAYMAEFIIEGTVTSTGGKTCCFRATFTPAPGAEPTPIVGATSNLSIPKISIPCSNGNALPRIYFNFSGAINLLNPELTVTSTEAGNQLTLSTTAVAEPEVYVEVVKRTLFCLNAAEAIIPCDGQSEDDNCCQCCDIQDTFTEDSSLCERITESIQSTHCGNTIYL